MLLQMGAAQTKFKDPIVTEESAAPYIINDINISYSPVPTEQEIRRKKILSKLQKSQISFFIGIPFMFLFGHYLVGVGGVRDRFRDYPEEYDFFTSMSARWTRLINTTSLDPIVAQRAKETIIGPLYHPKYPPSLHRGNEMFVWVNTIAFSSTIALNILYTELISSKKKSRIRHEFRTDRSLENYYMRNSF